MPNRRWELTPASAFVQILDRLEEMRLADDDVHVLRHGVDVLIDLASDRDGFAALAALVGRGGTAVTTHYAADTDALAAAGVTGINFAVSMTPELLARQADAVVSGRYAAPPITTVRLTDAPSLLLWSGPTAGRAARRSSWSTNDRMTGVRCAARTAQRPPASRHAFPCDQDSCRPPAS